MSETSWIIPIQIDGGETEFRTMGIAKPADGCIATPLKLKKPVGKKEPFKPMFAHGTKFKQPAIFWKCYGFGRNPGVVNVDPDRVLYYQMLMDFPTDWRDELIGMFPEVGDPAAFFAAMLFVTGSFLYAQAVADAAAAAADEAAYLAAVESKTRFMLYAQKEFERIVLGTTLP